LKEYTANENNLTLSDMIRGIQHCVNSSVEIAEQHYIKTIEKFFEKDGSLITQTIRLNENTQIKIPLICLYNHGSLDFEEMHIKTRLHIDHVQKKALETDLRYGDENSITTRGSFSVSLGDTHQENSENSLAEVEMVFKRKDAPEAMARLVDQINNMVKIEKINLD